MKNGQARSLSWGRAALVSLFFLAKVGCSSKASTSPASCADDPLACGPGETCWVKDCTCPSGATSCDASACTEFTLACMPASATATVGQNCEDEIGKVTCGAGQWCVQEMNVNQGDGVCASLCDPSSPSSCGEGLSCVSVGVALTEGAPTIHVCQVAASDGGIPTVDDDAGDGGQPDAPSDGPSGDGVGPNPILGNPGGR